MSKKNLDAPGVPSNVVLISIVALEQKLINKQMDKGEVDTLKLWLQHNWVKLDDLEEEQPIYAKPYSRFDYKYMMNGSQDNVDKLLLNTKDNIKIDAYLTSNATYSACKN